jgi:hypothetical protein
MIEPRVEKCRSCGAAVYFVKTEAGRWQILDAKPERRIIVEQGIARVVPTFTDHHVTCPQAEEWRNKQSQAPAQDPATPPAGWVERKDVS